MGITSRPNYGSDNSSLSTNNNQAKKNKNKKKTNQNNLEFWPAYTNGKNILTFSRSNPDNIQISPINDYGRACQKFWNEFLPQYLKSNSGVDLNFLQNYNISHTRPQPLD